MIHTQDIENDEEMHITQNVSGNWAVRNQDNQEVGGPFRRAADAQEWVTAEGYTVGKIQSWRSAR